MGIDIQSALVTGLPYNELKERFPGLDDALDKEWLDTIAPSYDAPRSECIIGFRALRSPQGGAVELTGAEDNKFEEAGVQFLTITGLEPKIFLTADVW